MATAQDYLMNHKWVKRMDGIFCTFDANKNGYLSAENWMITVDNLGKKSPGRSDAIAKLRKVTKEFTNALGLTEGVKADKEKFRELVANCFTADAAKMKRGEMASLEKLLKANFDFVDQNGAWVFRPFDFVKIENREIRMGLQFPYRFKMEICLWMHFFNIRPYL